MARLDQVDRPKLGERLRVARTARGLTQSDAANALSIARTTMVAIERGERQVRSEELVALSKLYGVSTHALLRDGALHVDLVGQFRRGTNPTATDRDGAEAVNLLHRLATAYVEIERQLGQPLRASYPPERPLQRAQLEQQAEDLAMELRAQLGLGLSPIPDLLVLAELELGLRVFVRDLPSKIAGLFAYHPELGACVLLNAKHPRTRRMWTLAHEIAHLLTQRGEADVLMLGADAVTSAGERFADLFAGALMMPGAAVRRHFAESVDQAGRFSPRHLILMAQRFHVSVEAACRRLEHLGRLPQGTYESLRERGLSGEVVRQVLGDPPPDERLPVPPRLALLAAEAHFRGFLSEGQLAEMLVLDRVTVRELLDALNAGEIDPAEDHRD